MEKVKVTIEIPVQKLGQLQFFLEDSDRPAPNKKKPEETGTALADAMNLDCPAADYADTGTGTVVGAAPEEVTEEKKITKTDLRALGVELTKAGKDNVLSAALAKFNAAKLSEVKEEDYGALYVELGGK